MLAASKHRFRYFRAARVGFGVGERSGVARQGRSVTRAIGR